MKEFKLKRPYIVATLEPMNNAPKVLSNEGILRPGKDISYRLGPEMGKRKATSVNLYQTRVEIRRKGYVTTVYSRQSEAIQLSEDIAYMCPENWCKSCRNPFRLSVRDEKGHRKRPDKREKRDTSSKKQKHQVLIHPDGYNCVKALKTTRLQRGWDTKFRDDEMWDEDRVPKRRGPDLVKLQKILDLVVSNR